MSTKSKNQHNPVIARFHLTVRQEGEYEVSYDGDAQAVIHALAETLANDPELETVLVNAIYVYFVENMEDIMARQLQQVAQRN